MFEIKDFKSKKKENVIFFNFCQSQNVFNLLFLLWLKNINIKKLIKIFKFVKNHQTSITQHKMSYFEELHPEMDRYLEGTASKEPEILKRLRKETYQKTTQPHMISGYLQGRLLSLISKIISPKNILEIGTFTGYAALCLAEGLQKDGKLITLDVNEDLAYLPQKYFAESEFASQINFQLQDAKEFLKNSDEIFDLIFIDADKENYAEYLKLVKPRMKSGGVLMVDNVLWYGKVLDEKGNKQTEQIKWVNKLIAEDADFENVILPLRDGIHLVRKI